MDLKSRSKVKSEFSMSSMTDLIFLLLIFFIITSTMVNPNAIKLLLPKANTQTAPTANPIEVAIDAELKVYVNNKETSYEMLTSQLQSVANQKGYNENTSIALSADKSVPMEYLVKVMKVGKEIGIPMIIRTGKE